MYTVIVGNIGTVYSGNLLKDALETYSHYKDISKDGKGRAANEQVTMFKDGEIIYEHLPEDADVKMVLNEYRLLNFTGKCPNGDNFLLTVAPEQLAQCRDRKEIILCLKFAAINLSVWIDPDQLNKIVDLCEEYNERSA